MTDDIYAEGYQKWQQRFAESSAEKWALRPTIDREVSLAAAAYRERYGDGPAQALDLGAGDGRHTLYLAAQGFAVTAIEAAPAGIDLIQQKLAAQNLSATLQAADLRDYTLPDEIDLLVSSYVIHLLPDPYEQIKKWQAGVRAGGIISLATRKAFAHDPDHYWFPQDFELRDIFHAAGWFILHAREEDNWEAQRNIHFRQRAIVAIKPD